jgi:hypothetical protein
VKLEKSTETVVLYGCEKWSHAIKNKQRLQVRFEVLTTVTMKSRDLWAATPVLSRGPNVSDKHVSYILRVEE